MENQSQFIIYQTEDGETKLDVRFQAETVWLTQSLMAQLFSTTAENVLIHLKNIYNDDGLEPNRTTKDFLVVRTEGKRQVDGLLSITTSMPSYRSAIGYIAIRQPVFASGQPAN